MNSLLTIFILFILSIPIAVVALVYSYICTRPGMIFDSLYNFLEKHLPEKLFFPLIGCEKCVSGQLSFWLFFFVVMPAINIHYNFFLHIYFVSQSILNVAILKYFYLNIEVDTIIEGKVKKQIQDPPELKPLSLKK